MTSHLLCKDVVCFFLLSHGSPIISCYTHPLSQEVVTVETFYINLTTRVTANNKLLALIALTSSHG